MTPLSLDVEINAQLSPECEREIRDRVQEIIREEVSKAKVKMPAPDQAFIDWLMSDRVLGALKDMFKQIVRCELHDTGYYDMQDSLRDLDKKFNPSKTPLFYQQKSDTAYSGV